MSPALPHRVETEILLYRLLRPAFSRNLNAIAQNLKQFYETGKPSNPDYPTP